MVAAFAGGAEDEELVVFTLESVAEFVDSLSAEWGAGKEKPQRFLGKIGVNDGVFRLGSDPIEEPSAFAEVGGDGAVRGDEASGGGEGGGFIAEEIRVGAEVAEGGGTRVGGLGFVEDALKFC